ncbi:DUF2934 domain-containing protein [Halotalea alkalilenta]|uniref:DUF2934 domain-containing protein n=1 Tax=Halotalea alkalilenta TaxID=376489 RepID=UPI0005BE0F11|nr:DUF2934 domain-containing protein [Halotalea alkalilenta]
MDEELRIRQLAYRIWEAEGRPSGQHDLHWQMACKLVAAERGESAQPARSDAAAGEESPDSVGKAAIEPAPAAIKPKRASTKAATKPSAKAADKAVGKTVETPAKKPGRGRGKAPTPPKE